MATTTWKFSCTSQSKSKTVGSEIRKGQGKTKATLAETEDEDNNVEAMQAQLEALSRKLRKSNKASRRVHLDAQRQGGGFFFFIWSTSSIWVCQRPESVQGKW